MFEGLVKRLLETYLAPYVDGITQNLQLAVWSGNIVLENLTLKKDITAKLALPFDVHFGKIGRISLNISWASLGLTPIKIVIDSVYICIGGIVADKSDEEILRQVRIAKEKLTMVLESEYSAFASSLGRKGDVNSSYLIRLSQKVLNNIQIDFTNIHLHCSDSRHSFGFMIDSISLRKFNAEDGRSCLKVETHNEVKEEPITHVCSLLGFSIYERLDAKLDAAEAAALNLETHDNGDTKAAEESNSAQEGGIIQRKMSDGESAFMKFSSHNPTVNILIDKLSFRLFLAINVKNKSIYASLKVGAVECYPQTAPLDNESLRIVLPLDSTKAFVAMWNDIMCETERSERLLMEKAYTVDLTADGVKGATKAEYIKLYTKYINSQKPGGEAMTSTDEERLNVLTDVVPARHLARWRFACRKLNAGHATSGAVAKLSPQTNTTRTTWFGWLRGVASSVDKRNLFSSEGASQAADSPIPDMDERPKDEQADETAVSDDNAIEYLPGGLVLTEEEIKLIKDAMTLDEMFEDSMATSSYYFECNLPHFDFVVDEGSQDQDVGDLLSVVMGNLQLQLYLSAAVDTSDRDTYDAYFYVNLDSFEVRFKNTVIMTFLKDAEMTVNHAVEAEEPYTYRDLDNFAMNLRVVHNVTNQGNLLMITGELKPMETHVIPAVLSELMEMLIHIQPTNTLDTTYNAQPIAVESSKASAESVSNSSVDSSIDDELWVTERNASRMAVEHLPSLFAFDIKFAAPILMLYTGENDRINLHFGTLNLKSNGACTLSQLSGTIELKETQLSCLRRDKKTWYNFLRPLPVKIHYDCDVLSKNINCDIIFEELFVQANPLDTAVLLRVPTEIAACLNGAKASLRSKRSARPTVSQGPRKSPLGSLAMNVKASVMFRHSGFAASSIDGCEIFKLEMNSVTLEVESAHGNIEATLGLERILVSNPATDMPLFFTRLDQAPVMHSNTITDEDNEFEDALEETAKSLQIEITSNDKGQKHINASITEMEGNWQHSSVKLIIDTVEEYKRCYNATKGGLESSKDLHNVPIKDVVASTPLQAEATSDADGAVKEPNTTTEYERYVWKEVESGNIDLQQLPTLLSEKQGKDSHSTVVVNIKGAAIVFWNAENQMEARLSVSGINYGLTTYDNGESISTLEVGTGKLTFGNRCLLSYTDNESLEEGKEKEAADKPLMTVQWKKYDSRNLGVQYSMCMCGALERVVFVYFQQDISRLMEYLDDGILSVFISRSYHKVVQAAAVTHIFYSFSVASPCFLFPENKAVLPASHGRYIPPGSTFRDEFTRADPTMACLPVNSKEEFCAQMAQRLSGIVDTWYFGSYLLFELGHLYFRNGYTHREDNMRKSTIYLKMLGTRASIIEQTNGSKNIMGRVLHSTDLAVCYIGGGMLDIGIDSEAWVLKLTSMQLTFIIDVFNENLCGASYKGRGQANVSEPPKPQSRSSIRLSLKRFQFDTLFASDKPLAMLMFNSITLCLNYASDNIKMTSCYQFGFCGKTLTVDDERCDSINAHRRLINCFVHEPNEGAVASVDDDVCQMEPSVNRLLQNWLRNYKAVTGHDFFSNASSADFYGIKCVVVNENNQTAIDCMVANADISLLCIHAMDLLRYFTLSYGNSSMAMYPKQFQATQTVANEKLYTFNFKATNGKFIAFTKMDSTTYPQLELSTDFVLEMTLQNASYNFLKVDVLGCKLERVYPISGKRQVLCSCLEVYGTGQYVRQPQGFKMFFNFVVPPSNLTLYTKDLSILLAAFTAVLSDGPSAAPPVKAIAVNTDGVNSAGRFISVGFNIKGINITFFDDMRKAFVPMMRLSMASEKIEYLSLPIEKRYSIIRCSTKLDYFNAVIGDWEPCLERCNCSVEYTNNITVDRQSNTRKSIRPGSEDEWKDFMPNKVLKVSSVHNILINITPSLCQLLLWFIPMLSNNIQKGLVYLDSKEEEHDLQIENSAYRYINLTGYNYQAFTLEGLENGSGGINGLKIVEQTNVPCELDSLVNVLRKGDSSNACIYLTARPPAEQVDPICEELGISNRETVIRDLMVTRKIGTTKENMRHSKSYMPSSYCTPFESGTWAAMVPLARNCCIMLKAPIEDIPDAYTDETLICEVKTPHPSHKLLMFTSTVRIYNRSGMPLLFTFVDSNMKVMHVPSLGTRGASISILDKGGAMNEEFAKTTTVHFPDKNVDFLRMQQKESGYTMLVEHNHFASVPECVFQNQTHAVMSFLPAPLAMNQDFMESFYEEVRTRNGAKAEAWMKLTNTTGWSKIIDSSRHQGTRVRQCYCPGFTKSNYLYFVVAVIKKKSSFPANVEMRDIVIYPALSIMNTLPIELDVCLAGNDRVPSDNDSTVSKKSGRTIQESVTLLSKSITHIYSLPPNESLSFMAKVCYNNSNIWSERVTKIYGTSETHTMLEIPIKGMSSIELELIRYPGGLPVSSTSFQGHLSLILNAPWWFIDRTGVGITFQKRLQRPVLRGLSFFSSEDEEDPLHLCVNGKVSNKAASTVRMPAVGGYAYALVEDGGKRHSVCLMTEKVSISGLSNHVTCRITSAIPSYLVTNTMDCDLYIRKDSKMQPLKIEPQHSIAVPWVSSKAATDPSSVLCIEFKARNDAQWSSPIIPSESHSGKTYMCVKQEKSNKPLVFCISVVPKCGTKYCSISYPQSNNEGYVLSNQCPYIKAAMVRTFHHGGDAVSKGSGVYFTAKYGQSVHFGWQQPFLNKSRMCQVMLWLDKNTVAPIKPLVINIGSPAFRYRQVEVTTPEYSSNHTVIVSAENRGDYIAINIKPSETYLECMRNLSEQRVTQMSLSSSTRKHNSGAREISPEMHSGDSKPIVDFNTDLLKKSESVELPNEADEVPTETVKKSLQVQLSQIGLSLVSHNLHEELFFLEMSTVSFVGLWNGDHQRLELRISDIQIDNQAEEHNPDEYQCSTILVNRRKASRQDNQRHFLQIYVDRPFAGCNDVCLKKVFIVLDDLEVDISDTLLSRVYNFYKECMKCMGSWGTNQKVDLGVIDSWVEREAKQKLSSLGTNPVPPRALVLDFLFVERFNLVLWCSFDLDKLHMLDDLMRMGLRIVCVSRHFELMGAPLQFQQEYFCNSRGSIRTFYEQIKDKYVHAALSCIGSLLGYSSLLNIPKIPINVGRNTIEFAAEAVDSVSSGIGSLLSKFTFDNEYINKRQRDRMNKPCGNMRDSIMSAGKSIGEGFMSLTNIVTKPIEGAQKGGMGGFIKGLGKGLAGSIVKPIDKVGQAVSQVSRTIKVNMSRQLDAQRWSVESCRRPRMLWGEYSQLKPYSLSDAEIKQQLGLKFAKNIVHCETVSKHSHPPSHLALLFYPSKIYYVNLKPNPTIIWKVNITSIVECRASCYGVIICTSEGPLQVPCTNSGLIYAIFTALQNAKRQSKSSIIIGPEMFQSYQ